jgi:hypothetical protein
MSYRDKDRQRESTKERVRRYRAKDVTPCVTPYVTPVTPLGSDVTPNVTPLVTPYVTPLESEAVCPKCDVLIKQVAGLQAEVAILRKKIVLKDTGEVNGWRTKACPKHNRMPTMGRWVCCGE